MDSAMIQRHQVEGWVVSLVLHGLLLTATLPLFRHLPTTIHPEPFHWDVTLVQSTPPADEPMLTAKSAEQNLSSSTNPIPVPTDSSGAAHTAASFAESVTSVPPILEASAVAGPQPQGPLPIAPPAEPVSVAQEAASIHPTVAEGLVPSKPVIDDHPVNSLRPSDSLIQQKEPLVTSGIQEQSAPAPISTSSSDTPIQAPESSQPTQPTAAVPIHTGTSSAVRADYGWLQRAIFQRLEELKRSSRPSLDESRPLKVLVKAVVSNDGTLMQAEIVKSSGLDRIDQEAMSLVQRAFPMKLDQTLDRSQIVMRIPITYSRD